MVMDGRSTSIGAGGAIVMQSDPDDEFQGMLLEAEGLVKAIALSAGVEPEPIVAPVEYERGFAGAVAHA
jgi:hypothetical protein